MLHGGAAWPDDVGPWRAPGGADVSEPPGHLLADAEYRSVVAAVQQWRAFALQIAGVFEEHSGRSDPAYQGAIRMVVLADQVLRILAKAD